MCLTNVSLGEVHLIKEKATSMKYWHAHSDNFSQSQLETYLYKIWSKNEVAVVFPFEQMDWEKLLGNILNTKQT